MDKRLIGISVLALGLIVASLALYFIGASTDKDSKSVESIGSKVASALACLFLLVGGGVTFLGFRDHSGSSSSSGYL